MRKREEGQKRALEQMRKMAGKYKDREPVTKSGYELLAEEIVGEALEQ